MTYRNQLTILFVGKRKGAFDAARRLNLKVLLLAERPPGRTDRAFVEAFFPCDFADPRPGYWAALADQMSRKHVISTVFALTEGAVLPAARIRQHLDISGLPVQIAKRCTDKLLMKNAIREAELLCADYAQTDAQKPGQYYFDRLGLPLVLKARIGSGGRGTQIFNRADAVPATLPDNCLAESYITGREMSVESLVYKSYPIFTNCTEYFQPGWANIVPASLEPTVVASVRAVNAATIKALGITDGITHLEVFLTPQGVVFGELAARPPGGHIMELIQAAYGFDLWQAWFEAALGWLPPLPSLAEKSAGVWLLHPGRGRVVDVRGDEKVKALAGVKSLSLRAKVGDEIGERLGVGQEVGHVLVCGADRDQVVSRLTIARQMLQVKVDPGLDKDASLPSQNQ